MWFPHTVLDRYEEQRDMLYNQLSILIKLPLLPKESKMLNKLYVLGTFQF